MSALLDEIIAACKAKAVDYEEYLKRIAALVKTVNAGKGDDTTASLDSFGKRAIFNNLIRPASKIEAAGVSYDPAVYAVSQEAAELLAIRIDDEIKAKRPADWRGIQTREQVIKRILDEILNDEEKVERIFQIIKQQSEY